MHTDHNPTMLYSGINVLYRQNQHGIKVIIQPDIFAHDQLVLLT